MDLLVLGVTTAVPFALLGIAAAAARHRGVAARSAQVAALATLPLSVAAHPLVQPLYLEAQDTAANRALAAEVASANLIGKSEQAVTAALGQPTAVRAETPRVHELDGRVAWQGETRTVWEYRPLRYYWSGSRLEVRFRNGVVDELRANVD